MSKPKHHIELNQSETKHEELTPYCLLCAVFKVFTLLLIAVGVLVIVLWLAFQPDTLKVYVDNASLARFNLTNITGNNNTRSLKYDLALGLSLRNPNKEIGVHYERFRAVATYSSMQVAEQDVGRFHQRKKSTTTLEVRLRGEAMDVIGGVVESYEREMREGWVSVSVKMYTRVRLKLIVVNSILYAPDVDCYLRIPVNSNGTRVFQRTACNVQSFT